MIDIGSVLGDRYELRRRLGVGGMGEVYLAFDRELEREVAIKSLLPHLARDDDLVQRFRREARTLARVRHPGIIALFDMLRTGDGALYLVLEYVPGRSLEAELLDGPLPWERCVDVGSQVCGALAAAHAQDVIHRDIKPSNILLEPSGLVRVADFGIARLAGASQVTRAGMAMGTPGFWAPEQALGEASSPQTDLYAVGAVLFQSATGRMPFVAEEEGPATALLNVTRPVPDPREAGAGVPDAAAAVIMRAMAKDPADRWGSAVEMASALRATLGAPPVTPMDRFVMVPPTAPPATPVPPDTPPPTVVTPPPTEAAAAPAATEAPMGTPAPPTRHTGDGVAVPAPAVTEPPRSDPGTPAPTVAAPSSDAPAAGATEVAADRRTRPARTRPAAPPAGGRRRRALVAGGALAVLAAGAVGLAVSGAFGGGGTVAEPGTPTRVRAGAGSLAVPADWSSSAGGSVPGLALQGATTARPPDAAGGERVVAGLSEGSGPTLLPAAFLDRLSQPPGAGERVALGSLQAYRHGGLQVEGLAAPVTAYVVPTTAGVQTVACVGGGAELLDGCAQAAASTRMGGGATAIPVGPDADYAARLRTALTGFDGRRTALRTRLADAGRPAGQADAASGLADAAGRAVGRLAGQDLGPEGAGLNEAVVAALREQQTGYRRMAAAARADDAAAWSAGRKVVAAGESDLGQALDALRARGYDVAGS